MSIAAPVKPSFPKQIARWVSSSHDDNPGSVVFIATLRTPVVQGHKYRVTATCSGFVKSDGSSARIYMLGTDADTIVSHRVGFESGAFAGIYNIPVMLCGIWTAPSDDANKEFNLALSRDSTADIDWALGDASHAIFIEDMGP